MLFKKWNKSQIFILVFTNIISVLLCLAHVNYVMEKEKNKYFKFLKEDGQIFAGIVLPNNFLADSEGENLNCAKAFLTDKESNLWKYVTKFNNPFGYKYQVFAFEALPSDERLVVK